MINSALQLIFFALIVSLMIRSLLSYRKQKDRNDMRYLLYWCGGVVLLGICSISDGWIFTGQLRGRYHGVFEIRYRNYSSAVLLAHILVHLIVKLLMMACIYYAFAFTVTFTEESDRKRRNCRRVLFIMFWILVSIEMLHLATRNEVFFVAYRVIFPLITGAYLLQIIRLYHVHAKTQTPVTGWRMHFSKWGCICFLAAALSTFIPTDNWAVRPNYLLVVLAWGLFHFSHSIPVWLQRKIRRIEIAPQLFDDAHFMWRYINARYHPIVALGDFSIKRRWIRPNSRLARLVLFVHGSQKLLHDGLFLLNFVMDWHNQIVAIDEGRLGRKVRELISHLNLSPDACDSSPIQWAKLKP